MRALPLLVLLMTTTPTLAQDSTPPATTATTAPAATPGPSPCASEERRQFDFWVGDWVVTGPKGNVVGHNRVESILGGCVLAEHWTSATGGGANDGRSYNLYNADLKRWEQLWVDAGGSRLMLSGGLVEGRMVLEGQQELADSNTGLRRRERISWTPYPDGSVRQLWEFSLDDGKSWAVAFDGMYRRLSAR